MIWIKLFFFLSLLIVFYSYVGYGILIWLLLKLKKKEGNGNDSVPYTSPIATLIVAAYNEEEFIRKKIENTLQLDYPTEKLKIIFVTDGSLDNTGKIVEEYPRIMHLHENARKGKIAAIKRAMAYVDTSIVIFSDANTFLNKESILKIVSHYQDPEIGGVAGEKKISVDRNETLAGTGEGFYWKYEAWLKKLDSDFYTVVGAAGELFSIRTELYEHPGNDTLLDDFVISLTICKKGYRIIYEPGSYAIESPSNSMKEERKRKIRICAGAFQSMRRLKSLLNIFKYPKLSFQYISHRVLRWAICPFLLPIIFILNLLILISSTSYFYNTMFLLQVLFYTLALWGWIFSLTNKRFTPAYIAYYFLFMNISLYYGFIKYLQKRQSVLWDKAERK